MIEKKNKSKESQKVEIEKYCRKISDNLKPYDPQNKISYTLTAADFEENFDLVTEQDLMNVHSSTKFVIERAKSDLIRNVVKSLNAKKIKDQQDNEFTGSRRNSSKSRNAKVFCQNEEDVGNVSEDKMK